MTDDSPMLSQGAISDAPSLSTVWAEWERRLFDGVSIRVYSAQIEEWPSILSHLTVQKFTIRAELRLLLSVWDSPDWKRFRQRESYYEISRLHGYVTAFSLCNFPAAIEQVDPEIAEDMIRRRVILYASNGARGGEPRS